MYCSTHRKIVFTQCKTGQNGGKEKKTTYASPEPNLKFKKKQQKKESFQDQGQGS